MTNQSFTGISLAPYSEEDTALFDHWLTYLKKIVHQCIIKTHLKWYQGDKYTADDFWMVIILHTLMNLSFEEAANRINRLLWKEKLRHQR